ncbi:MAG: GNAT family N-acetyltransferase [Coprobacillus sp.]
MCFDNCNKTVLETDRLILRELQQSDIQDLSEILQDPEVVYAYEHIFTDADVRKWFNRQRQRYRKYGFELWAVIFKKLEK